MNTLSVLAQTAALPTSETGVVFFGPQYIIGIVVGIVLALAFELFLTLLSVATGLTLIDVPQANAGDGATSGDPGTHDEHGASSGIANRIRKAINACGIWATLSGVVSLFFASWLAVELSLATSETSAAVLGLTIWGVFCLIVYYLNMSVGGATLRAATAGLGSIGQSVTSVFTPSTAKSQAKAVSQSVRDDIFGSSEFHQMKRDLRDYLRDIADRVSDGHEQADAPPSVDREETAELSTADRTIEAVLRLAGYSPARARQLRDRVEDYLRNTNRDELNPDAIKAELQDVFKDGGTALRDRWDTLDRNTLKGLLAARDDLNEEEVERIFGWVENGLDTVRESLATRGDQIRKYVDRVDDERLSYDDIEDDVRQLLDDPKAGYQSLQSRLRSLDRDTIVQLLAARRDISGERAEQLVSRIERVRDRLMEQADRLKQATAEKLREAQQATLQAVDEARETAAATAWWAVGAATFSGTAAVLGGVVAVSW